MIIVFLFDLKNETEMFLLFRHWITVPILKLWIQIRNICNHEEKAVKIKWQTNKARSKEFLRGIHNWNSHSGITNSHNNFLQGELLTKCSNVPQQGFSRWGDRAVFSTYIGTKHFLFFVDNISLDKYESSSHTFKVAAYVFNISLYGLT